MQHPELLAPAGDRERLEAAVRYGADAVYLGGQSFGMRATPQNFDDEGLAAAASYAHENGVRIYLTCNTFPHPDESDCLPEFLRMAAAAGVDAFIIADIGTLLLAKQLCPDTPVHLSTQAGVVNQRTARAYYEMGAERVVLARELSLNEIRRIRDEIPPALELECFVHGAMCVSVSGRCLLSQYLTGRDANRGECAQPCRWGYHLVEEKRPGMYFPIGEDAQGSYILNAKDLCMVEHIAALTNAGISSLKIEGRAKSAYYTAVVTNAYRGAIDAYLKDPAAPPPDWVQAEVRKVSHRAYSTGFYFGQPDQFYENAGYIRDWDVIAVVEGWADGLLEVSERNRFSTGEVAEVMIPRAAPVALPIDEIYDLVEDCVVAYACHPMRRYRIPCAKRLPAGAMLRRLAVEDMKEKG